MAIINATVNDVTQRIISRSVDSRQQYLSRIERLAGLPPGRETMACTNLAHAFAAAPANDKIVLHAERTPNLAIVTAYNDILSAHQPYEQTPERIRGAARAIGATAQVAGGTPAMCDGVTQGQPGMELSLFSRDVIAMSTAIALSHNVFDATVLLGVCDKIVPGLLMGALSFGHLPTVFIPAGPMTSGLPNKEKAATRQRYAEGKASREELLASESASYHGPGTCTFYGTANSNQMMMEVMGLHMPGAAFVNPGTPLRHALTEAAAQRALQTSSSGNQYTPLGKLVDEKCIVNAITGLLATGGSTNHTLHLVAIARTAGIKINWDDFNDLGKSIPLLTHIYPSGQADVNQFQAAGGMALIIRELLDAGLMHDDVMTVAGQGGLRQYTAEPWLDNGKLLWRAGPSVATDSSIIASVKQPFRSDGGLCLVSGNLGRAIAKTSAVHPEHKAVEAPALVFHSQNALRVAFEAGELERDFVAVLAYQGPRANGMPELHKLTPILGVLLDRGFNVALVTDGRMSGASGKVPAAIHVSPECVLDGPLARVRNGDIIRLNTDTGELSVLVDETEWNERKTAVPDLSLKTEDMGRELFTTLRNNVCSAEEGAVSLFGS